MAQIVNLRQVRKRRTRAQAEAAAQENRVLHGRTKAEKQRDRIEKTAAASFLDGHRRDPAKT